MTSYLVIISYIPVTEILLLFFYIKSEEHGQLFSDYTLHSLIDILIFILPQFFLEHKSMLKH